MVLPTVTLGIPACKKHIRIIVLSFIAIILICMVRAVMPTRTIPEPVCSDERLGLAAVGCWGGH